MSRTFARNDFSATRGAAGRVGPSVDGTPIDRVRWHDVDDDDPYDRPMDDEEYEDFRWEEVPDDRQVLLPDELWDDDDWD
jgi:hypothetical protein